MRTPPPTALLFSPAFADLLPLALDRTPLEEGGVNSIKGGNTLPFTGFLFSFLSTAEKSGTDCATREDEDEYDDPFLPETTPVPPS